MREAFKDVPPEEIEQEAARSIAEMRAERQRLIAAMREPFRGVSAEEIERETAKAVAEVREEMRAERKVVAARRRFAPRST